MFYRVQTIQGNVIIIQIQDFVNIVLLLDSGHNWLFDKSVFITERILIQLEHTKIPLIRKLADLYPVTWSNSSNLVSKAIFYHSSNSNNNNNSSSNRCITYNKLFLVFVFAPVSTSRLIKQVQVICFIHTQLQRNQCVFLYFIVINGTCSW